MESRLPVSQYPKAWKDYNRRWYAVWLGLLVSILYFIGAMNYMHRAKKGEAVLIISDHVKVPPVSMSKTMSKVIAIGPAIVFLMAPCIWFFSWTCPRCGFDFTDWAKKFPVRSNECSFCKLRRNAVSELDDTDNGQMWRTLSSEEDANGDEDEE